MFKVNLEDGILWISREFERYNSYFFLGSGAAISTSFPSVYQMPTGEKIRDRLLKFHYSDENIEKCLEKFRKTYSEFENVKYLTLEMIWSKIIKDRAPHDIYLIIYDILNGRIPIPTNYRILSKIMIHHNLSGILTTNFDEKLEAACYERYQNLRLIGAEKYNKIFQIVSEKDFEEFPFPQLKTIVPIYKLHGTLSSPYSMKSAMEQLEEFSTNKKKVLKDIFSNPGNLIIFIGYGFHDVDLRKFLEENTVKARIYIIDKNLKALENTKLGASNKTIGIKCESEEFFIALNKAYLRNVQKQPEDYYTNINFNPQVKKFLEDFSEFSTYHEKIEDIIYGEIKFKDENIKKIINSADFQRLRDIRQLSFVNLIYPSATHSRLSHSIGVAYLMEKIINKFDHEEDSIIYLIAALLHDVSHGPFGHVLEFIPSNNINPPFHHENFIKFFIEEGLYELADELNKITTKRDREHIIKIATGNIKDDCIARFLNEDSIDLDRLDFILRDTYYINKFRIDINHNKLIEKIKLYEDENTFAFDEEIKSQVKLFLETYRNMYEHVYHNPLNLCAQKMVATAISEAADANYIELKNLFYYTDSDLFNILEKSDIPLVQNLMRCVKYNKLFKNICSFTINREDISEREIYSYLKQNGLEMNSFESLVLICIPPSKANSFQNLFFYHSNTNSFGRDINFIENNYQKLYKHRVYIFVSHKYDNSKRIIKILNQFKEKYLKN
ncbi:MAG: SIR2 family protein [Candidatus Helarchaeota archaeon]